MLPPPPHTAYPVWLQYTPLETDRHQHYYNVRLQSISVGGQDLGVGQVGGGCCCRC